MIAQVIDGELPQQPSLRRVVADNVAFELARERGYDPVGVASGFEHVAPRRADVYVDGGQLNKFEISLLSSTYAGDIVAALAPDFASAQHRDRILFNLSALSQIASTTDRPPAFVFAQHPGAPSAGRLRRGRQSGRGPDLPDVLRRLSDGAWRATGRVH